MRILHTSDWHFGITLHNISMAEEQLHFKSELIRIIKEEAVELVIVAGDVFDSSVASAAAISLYNETATEICKNMQVPMIVIAGNHDGAARLSSMRELLASSGLYVTGKISRNPQPTVFGNVAVYSLPYFTADEMRSLYPDEEIKSTEQAMALICSKIKENMDASKTNIVVAHAFVNGAALSGSDRSASVGTASLVSYEVFDGFDYVALGHIHRPQHIKKNIIYSGSPIKYSLSEAGQEKSVTVFDTATGEIKTCTLHPLREMRIIKGTFDELSHNSVPSDDYISIELTDSAVSMEITDFFRNCYPNLVSVSGKSPEGSGHITLTAAETQQMSPSDMLRRFYTECFGETVTDAQVALFENAVFEAEKEGDLS